jgi:hypothetical protein
MKEPVADINSLELSQSLKDYISMLEYIKKEYEKRFIELFCIPIKNLEHP